MIKCHDGVERNASQLLSAPMKIARTWPVSVLSANQDKLMESSGSAGAEASRVQNIGIVGKVESGYDSYAGIPGLSARMNPMKLEDNAIYMVSPYDPRREVRGKFAYIDDDEIPPAAEELTRYRYGLDPAITSQLRYYADRWDPRWHVEFVAELADEPDLEWPIGPAGVAVPRAEAASAAATATPVPAGSLDQQAPEAVSAPAPSTPDPKETPVPADDETSEGLPADLYDPNFDIWGALGVVDVEEPAVRVNEAAAAAGDPNGIFNVDTSEIEAALTKMRAWHEKNAPARKPVGEPLESVLFILAKPGAPEWVPTEVLALVIGALAASRSR